MGFCSCSTLPPPPHFAVFAYGATGAGKTHTMLGSQDDPGVMYLTMKELYTRMDQMKDEKVFELAFSYLEVREHTHMHTLIQYACALYGSVHYFE